MEDLAEEAEPAAESADEPWPVHSRGNRDTQRHSRPVDGTKGGTPVSNRHSETRSDEAPAAYRAAAVAAQAAPNQEKEVASRASGGQLESFASALDYVLGHPGELGSADLSWLAGCASLHAPRDSHALAGGQSLRLVPVWLGCCVLQAIGPNPATPACMVVLHGCKGIGTCL